MVFRAIQALADTDHSAALVDVLGDSSRHFLVRQEAAKALGQQRNVDMLLPFSDDKHDGVRQRSDSVIGQWFGWWRNTVA